MKNLMPSMGALLLANVGLRPALAVMLSIQPPNRGIRDLIARMPPLARAPGAFVRGNNCGQGKLLPSVYLLGAKNAATTSIYRDLADALGFWPAPDGENKEWHFFQTHADVAGPEAYKEWMDALPACPIYPSLLGDFSVSNAWATPLPHDLRWALEASDLDRKNTDPGSWDTPKQISSFHKKAGGRPPKLIMMLRDPLVRTHSEYYQTLPKKNSAGCRINSTFVDAFQTNVRFLQSTPMHVTDWFWKNFYARQLETYLHHFEAAQFIFIPFRQYVSLDTPGVSAGLLGRLGLGGTPWAKPSDKNEHLERPDLDEVLPPSMPSRLAFEALMAPEAARLARLLARAQLGGAFLAGYNGPQGDEEQVEEWLLGSW